MSAKKKSEDEELKYLQMPLPSGGKRSKLTKVSFHGLNMAQTIDTGVLCDETNISTTFAPYLVPSPKRSENLGAGETQGKYKNAVSIHGFEDVLIVVYPSSEKKAMLIDYIKLSGERFIKTGVLSTYTTEDELTLDRSPRSIVRFNVYSGEDPISGTYDKKLLIFPDKKSMDFVLKDDDNLELHDISVNMKSYENEKPPFAPPANADKSYYQINKAEGDGYGKVFAWVTDSVSGRQKWIEQSTWASCPDIEYATVHLSRLFGVGNGKVYASGFNDYSNWNLDTADEYNESNAWVSATQSNIDADSPFVGITTFQNHVVAFKTNYMHEIYNTKNPFRVQDIFGEGCVDGRTIKEVDGRLIFLSDDNVKIYNGGNPENIGYPLGVDTFGEVGADAAAGSDGRKYYLYSSSLSEDKIFVYDTYCEQWAVEKTEMPVIGFAHNNRGFYVLNKSGNICVYTDENKPENYSGQSWSFETDTYTGQSIDIKHLNKVQVLLDMYSGAEIRIYMISDNIGTKKTEPLYAAKETRDGINRRTIRFVPRNTATYGFKLRFEGTGFIKIYGLEMIISDGGGKYIE